MVMDLKVSSDEAALSTMASLCLYAQGIAIKSILDAMDSGEFTESYKHDLRALVDKFFERSKTLLLEVGYTHEEVLLLLVGAKRKTMTIMTEMLMKDILDNKESKDEAS